MSTCTCGHAVEEHQGERGRCDVDGCLCIVYEPIVERHRCGNCQGGRLPRCEVPGCVGGVVTIPAGSTVVRLDDAGLGVSREMPGVCPDCGDLFCDGPGNCPPKRGGLRPIGEGGTHVSY